MTRIWTIADEESIRPKRRHRNGGSNTDRAQVAKALEEIYREVPDGKSWAVAFDVRRRPADKSNPLSYMSTSIRAGWYANDPDPRVRERARDVMGKCPLPKDLIGRFDARAEETSDGQWILLVRVVQPGEPRPPYKTRTQR